MNVVVCVKQIPDPAAPQSLNPGTNTLDRSGKLIMDDSDNYGVEMALQLASGEGDEVTLVSMAPGGETSGLRTGLAMGAAKAILISDDALAGSDALGTARVLAAAIARANPDLVVMATESSDGYTGTLPVQVAELMGLPSVTFAKAIAVDGDSVKVERQTEAGYDEVVCPLPALVTVTAGVVEPRYPSFKGIMAAKSKPVDNLTVADLGIDASLVGAAGAGQEITDVSDAEARGAGEIVVDEGDGAERVVAFLEKLKVVEMPIDKVWVLAEVGDGGPTPVTLELLTEARAVASTVEAVAWGADAASLAGPLGEFGATTLYDVGDLGGTLPGVPVAAALAALIEGGNAPDALLIPATYDGRDVAGRLSAKLGRPVLTNVTGLVESDGGLASQHPVFGGTQIVTAHFTGAGPAIFVVRAKSFAAEPSGGAAAAVVPAAIPDVAATNTAKIVERHVEERSGPKLDEAAVVVSGGRGLGDAANYALIEELAKLLHGAAGASRAIVDAGWVPYSHQVGQTGKTVKPTVYIACGISGATQHLVGMKGSKNIVAINKDREAPIFSVADLGIVGDVHKVLPALIEALKAKG